MSRQDLFIIWTVLSLITVIDTIVLIPAKPILPPDAEYNSITSGILGNYYYVFHALEVVNVSLLGIHSKTINHMRKPSQNVHRRSKIFDSVSISYDMTETSRQENTENDQLKRDNSFLSVSHSINLSEFCPSTEMRKEDSDPSIINCEIEELKNMDDETVINNGYVQGLNLPIINIQSADEVTSTKPLKNQRVQPFQSKDQSGFFALDKYRQTRRSLSLDADPLYLVDQNDILSRIHSLKQSTDNNNDYEMDSLATEDRCPTPSKKEFNESFDGDEENNDAVSIHSLAIDPFEAQSHTDYSIKDANDQKSLPPSPAGSIGSAASSISAYNLNSLFFENNFTEYAVQEVSTTPEQQSASNSIKSPVQSVSVTITNVEDSHQVDTDNEDGKSDIESVSSVVLANKFFKAYVNHKATPLDTMYNSKASCRSCSQSPTESITSICSSISGYNLNSLFSDSNTFTKHKRATVDDGVLCNSRSGHGQVRSQSGLRGKKKSRTQPPSPVGSTSSACSSISAYHLNSLFDNDKFCEQLSDIKVDKKSITEWITNQQQYLPLHRQQSDDIEATATCPKDGLDIKNHYSNDRGDRCQELIDTSHRDQSNRWNVEPMISTTENSGFARKNDIQANDTESKILNSNTAHNPSQEPAKSNILNADTVLNPLPPHLDPNDEVNYSPYRTRKTTISTIAEEYDSFEIPDITVTRTNSEEDIKVLA